MNSIVERILDALVFLFLVLPWLIFLVINGWFIAFGGRIGFRAIKHEGFIIRIRLHAPARSWKKTFKE
jgi:hypothetical protein